VLLILTWRNKFNKEKGDNMGKRQLKKEKLLEKLECMKNNLTYSLIIVNNVYKKCGYSSKTSFLSYVIKPLIELGYLEKLGGGVYKIKTDKNKKENEK
jgi:AraC-like DNA-binding protein